jgi:hypothetical protein
MPCQLVIMVESSVQTEASISAVTITGLRPMASDSGPVNSSPIASIAGGNGERNTAAGRRYAKLVRQHGQDRLNAIEQGKGGQTGGKERSVTRINWGTTFNELTGCDAAGKSSISLAGRYQRLLYDSQRIPCLNFLRDLLTIQLTFLG